MHNTPKPPSLIELQSLLKYVVDSKKGLVLNSSGKSIGTIASDGYCRISIKSEKGQRGFRRSHIIWWGHYGEWPKMELDHKDRDKVNDSIDNLREATRGENSANRPRAHKLLPGVHYKPRMKTNPYAAIKTVKGKQIHVGFFPTEQQAHEAYIAFGG